MFVPVENKGPMESGIYWVCRARQEKKDLKFLLAVKKAMDNQNRSLTYPHYLIQFEAKNRFGWPSPRIESESGGRNCVSDRLPELSPDLSVEIACLTVSQNWVQLWEWKSRVKLRSPGFDFLGHIPLVCGCQAKNGVACFSFLWRCNHLESAEWFRLHLQLNKTDSHSSTHPSVSRWRYRCVCVVSAD